LERAITGLDERAIGPHILFEANVHIRREFRFHIGTHRDFFDSRVMRRAADCEGRTAHVMERDSVFIRASHMSGADHESHVGSGWPG